MNINEFIEKLADQFEDTELSELQSDTEFQQLDDWSSLSTLGIIALIRTEYGKKITADEIRSCRTICDLYELAEA